MGSDGTLLRHRQLKFDEAFIYKKMPVSQAQEAFQLFQTQGRVKGKVMLVNEEELG